MIMGFALYIFSNTVLLKGYSTPVETYTDMFANRYTVVLMNFVTTFIIT